jgi:enoyl-[acyl-carrier protein] reductase I
VGLLEGKTALVFGVANKRSIAWGIAQAMHEQGAEIGFSYAFPKLERRVRPLAESVDARLVEECSVTDDDAIDRVFEKVEQVYGAIDVLVHSIAYAEREDLTGRFVDTGRAGFKTALEISAYSLVALARRAEKLMPHGGSIVTITAYGGVAVLPQYNVMGVAKAALESCVR